MSFFVLICPFTKLDFLEKIELESLGGKMDYITNEIFENSLQLLLDEKTNRKQKEIHIKTILDCAKKYPKFVFQKIHQESADQSIGKKRIFF